MERAVHTGVDWKTPPGRRGMAFHNPVKPERQPVVLFPSGRSVEEGNRRKMSGHWKQTIMAVMLAALVLGPVPSASAQSRDEFSYWDANGNGDLTCSEAMGRDEGLRLPAYEDDRDGTGIIYEWLERTRSSDTDNDGIACDSASNPNGYIPNVEEPAPDLVVLGPNVSDSSPETGGTFWLIATVTNQGDGRSAATTVRYYRSTDATITTSDTLEGTDAVRALVRPQGYAATISLTAPSTAGTYYYGACVDAVTGESDTTNNCSTSVQVDVSEPPPQTNPDLVVDSPSVSDNSPVAGVAFTLSATVRNGGDGDAAATTLRYYQSADATIATSDTAVGTDAVGELSASGTSAESIDLTAPAAAGTYYYGACVDAVTGESDTTNNCSTSVQVTVPVETQACPADAETWRGLKVCDERPRDGYDRDGYGTGYSSLEDEIIAALPATMKKNGQVYTPYSCIAFDITAEGTAATDIEHIVALAEAHDSGIADNRRRDIASDLDNLTIADPMVNRSEKSDRDAAEWVPDRHGAWFAERVISVKREYELSVDPAERNALEMLLADGEAELNCVGPDSVPGALEFAHFANGSAITSDLVLVNVAPHPIRPALYFYDREGDRIAAESVAEVTEELEITEDGSLTVQTEMQPLEALTISTHGQGELVAGSVTVVSNGPMGGVLRFDLPGVGVAGVGAGQPLRDALFPARRQEGAISTAAAIRNLHAEELVVSCQLMQEGAVLEEVEIELQANGQDGRFIEEVFTATDTSNFVGLVRCRAEGEFTGVAVELDAGNGIFTTLPVLPVDRTVFRGGEYALDFAHFANGSSITSDLVLVNVSTQPSRPAGPFTTPIPPTRPSFYFYDRAGERLAAQSVVEVTGELEVAEDGGLTIQSELKPLQAVTISTHGQGEVVAGSVRVVAEGPLGGVLRFDLPGVGVAGVGAGQAVRDALFPARRQEGGISTAAAIRNLEAEELVVSCQLMQEGEVLEEVDIELEANGQDGPFIEEVFTRTDTSDFVGLVRCMAAGEFTGVAVELDAGSGIFTTLPVVPVEERTRDGISPN